MNLSLRNPEIAVRMGYPNAVLILGLDRLIKKKFVEKLQENPNELGITEEKTTKIKREITKHNNQLIENLYLSPEEVKTANKKIQLITKLYGIKDYNPHKGKYAKTGRKFVSIQHFLDHQLSAEAGNYTSLSGYFYSKLNMYVGESVGLNGGNLPKIKSDKLAALFKVVFSDKEVRGWQAFEEQPEAIMVMDQIQNELKLHDSSLQDFTIFKAAYYSRSRKKIHNFELKFAKNPVVFEEEDYKEGDAEISFQEGKLKFKGKVRRKGAQVTATLYNVDASRERVNIFAYVPQNSKFSSINLLQGIYTGDSVRNIGKVFAMEFIAAKEDFLTQPDNSFRIFTTLLLRRNNFDIRPYDLTAEKLDRGFSVNNLLQDEFKDVIARIKEYGMVFLNYGFSGGLLLSKIKFDHRFKIELTSPFPKLGKAPEKRLVKQSCNLSARNKGSRIIATTYLDGHLKNVVVLDVKDQNDSVFTGSFSHHGGKKVFSSYIVAVISEHNDTLVPGELTERDLQRLETIPVYAQAVKKLKDLKDLNSR